MVGAQSARKIFIMIGFSIHEHIFIKICRKYFWIHGVRKKNIKDLFMERSKKFPPSAKTTDSYYSIFSDAVNKKILKWKKDFPKPALVWGGVHGFFNKNGLVNFWDYYLCGIERRGQCASFGVLSISVRRVKKFLQLIEVKNFIFFWKLDNFCNFFSNCWNCWKNSKKLVHQDHKKCLIFLI